MLSSHTPTTSPVKFYPWSQGLNLADFADLTHEHENINWHDLYTDTATAMGYTGYDGGLCYGFASTGPAAFWVSVLGHASEGMGAYLSRLCALLNVKKNNTTRALATDIGANAFFNRIKMVQDGQNYKNYHDQLFGIRSKYMSKDYRSDEIERMIKPVIVGNLLPENPWRKRYANTMGIYTDEELETYLQLMMKYFSDVPFELELNTYDHTAYLCYCPVLHEYIYFDANNDPLCIFNANDTKTIAKKLKNRLYGINSHTIISSSIKSITRLEAVIDPKLRLLESDSTWINIHKIKNKKALVTDAFGNPALMVAIRSKQSGIAGELIRSGANINEVCKDNGWTPLVEAICSNLESAVSLLLTAGADPNQPLKNGNTPLCYAVDKENESIVRLLLDSGADVNQARTTDNATALFLAAKKGLTRIAKLLLEHEADPLIRVQGTAYKRWPRYFTALEIAKQQHSIDHPIVRLLIKYSPAAKRSASDEDDMPAKRHRR